MRSHLKLQLFGPFEARLGSGPPVTFSTRRSQALLACLALRPGRAHSRESLTALLWGEADDTRARQSFRQALTDLRKSLKDAPGLLISRESVALREQDIDSDVATFEGLLAQGTPEALEQAIELYRGELLDGFSLPEAAYEEWLRGERDRVRTLAMQGFARLVDRQMEAAQDDKAIRTATQLVEFEPFHEPAHRALMRLYHRQGHRAAALRQYQLCVQVLRRELGVEPEEETIALYQEIVARQPASHAPAASATGAAVPVAGTWPLQLLQAHDTPLIGRATEMAALRDALARAWEEAGSTALVLGEAGIGKSRLAEELAAHAVASGGRVFAGRSFELERILPFRPWTDAFRDGRLTADCPELAGFATAWQVELVRLFPDWETPGSVARGQSEDRVRLYEAVAQLLAHLARQQPILMILEDLHWADDSSLRLLAFLHHRIAPSRVLLLGTARDDEVDASPDLGRFLHALGADPRICRLTLAPLPQNELGSLVRELLRAGTSPAATEEVVARIWGMSEGNPFVAVEATRALGQRQPSTQPAPELPERVRTMIAHRLEELDADARELAATAAVIGRELDFPLLQHAAGTDARSTAVALEKLVRRRVLHPVGERFAFTHERIREVAYGQLLPPRRRLLHERVALAMEELYAGNLVPYLTALGAHFGEAGAWEKAAAYMRHAGIRAHERSASREAATCFERALDSLERLPHTPASDALAIDLRLDLQSSLIVLGELPRIVDYLREARTLAEAIDDRQRLGWILTHATHCSWWLGDCDAAVESGTAAATIAQELGDVSLQIVANYRLGQARWSRAEYGEARNLLVRALELLPEDRVHELFGMSSLPAVVSYTFLSWAERLLGELDAGDAHAKEGVRIAEAAEHPYSAMIAYHALALGPLVRGDFPAAIATAGQALEICRKRELWFIMPWIAGELGRAYALSGRTGEAVPLLERTVEETERLRMMMIHPLHLAVLAEAYMLVGRHTDAFHTIEQALRLARAHKQRGFEAEALKILGDITGREAEGRQRAEQAYQDCLALAESLGMRPLTAICQLAIGELHARHHDVPGARTRFDSAAIGFRDLEMAYWAKQANEGLAALG
ncbi:MAG: AAA family ATPase [Betaproteobacteria bacterium]|nr:AAA family ATPase [Betaproteobacteria bacterium]